MDTTREPRTLAILAIVAAIAITVWFVAMSVGPPPAGTAPQPETAQVNQLTHNQEIIQP
jgi:hypothetical protein